MKSWVKVIGSDVRLEYPQKRVDSPPGCKCDHPIHPHYHFEPDYGAKPVKRRISPQLYEDNGDGTYTRWGYTVWGPVGVTGTLAAGVEVAPLSTKADRKASERLEGMIARSLQSQHALVTGMRAARDAREEANAT